MIDLNIEKTNFIAAKNVDIPDSYYRRIKTGIDKLDECIGGGFIEGMTFTLAGTPGCGKTTFMLQFLDSLSDQGYKTAYISSEEPVFQLAFTSKRIGIKNVQLANMNVIESIFEESKKNGFDIIIIDSLPAIISDKGFKKVYLETYLANYITMMAKKTGIVVGTILHSTKRGTYKGTTLFPHNVDCNIMLRRDNDKENICEVEITKNRFGSTGKHLFEITEKGFDFTSKIEDTKESEPNTQTQSTYW